ncbi:MAG: hypothetical protein JW746_07865 [Candidatus Krumholzibacteriota bacterium]|nr:hypothetical protein [Candidatus Krumholzibacteriota bacterium]
MDRCRLRVTIGVLLFFVAAVSFSSAARVSAAADIISPAEHFGFAPGTDRELFDYEELIEYMKILDSGSPRLKLLEVGRSPMGRPVYVAFISSDRNIEDLDLLKEINRRLAVDPDIGTEELGSMIEKGKVFFLATLSMHSNEVGPSQASPVIAYDLVSTNDPVRLKWLDDVVFMMNPCHNPDGMDMVVEHYRKYRGTDYEGCRMPGVYHKYVGHDNNRDFVTLTQSDTKALSHIQGNEWYPQVMVEKHQMGSTGVRYFVPPNHDPIADNIDAGVWNWMGIFGSNLIKDMTHDGLAGIAQHYLFDDYWPGSTETSIWKNVISLLTEAASVQYASPIYIEPNELSVYGKGLSEYKKSINMPLLWKGGWWRLSDIVDYEISSTMSMIRTSSLHREAILKFRNDLCRSEVKKGLTEPPYYYILQSSRVRQHDISELAKAVDLLIEHGVNVYTISKAGIVQDGYELSAGDVVIPLAQPIRAFIKEVMEKQEFPVRHYTPGGKIMRPYDITSWSLPLHRGLTCIEIDKRNIELESALQLIEGPFSFLGEGPEKEDAAAVFAAQDNDSYKAAFKALSSGMDVFRLDRSVDIDGTEMAIGSFVISIGKSSSDKYGEIRKAVKVEPVYITEVQAKKLCRKNLAVRMPKIALVETNFHDMDAGWTRYLMDTYSIPFDILKPDGLEGMDIDRYDLIIFPDNDKSILMTGRYKSHGEYHSSAYPPEFIKGMGEKGLENLFHFIGRGGRAVAWGRSAMLFTGPVVLGEKENKEEFTLPISDLSEDMEKSGLYCPGSLVRAVLKEDHPLTLGMQSEAGVFFRGKPVFITSVPRFDMDRRVIARFPEKGILMSGYAEQISEIGDKSAMVWIKKGKGEIVLFAFSPQFRASTAGTYKLLFNSILMSRAGE